MSNTNIPGVNAALTLDVDWTRLGEHVATRGSDDQAALLTGLVDGLSALDPVARSRQIRYIAVSLFPIDRQDVRDFCGELAADILEAQS